MSLFHITGYLFKKEMTLVFNLKIVCIISTLRAWFEYIFILIMHFLVAHCGIIVTFIVQCLCRYRYWLWSLHFWYVAKSEMIQHEFQMSLRCISDTFTCFYTHRTVEKMSNRDIAVKTFSNKIVVTNITYCYISWLNVKNPYF